MNIRRTALEIIEELQDMSIEINAYAGGPYFIEEHPFESRTKLRDIRELRHYLERKRNVHPGMVDR